MKTVDECINEGLNPCDFCREQRISMEKYGYAYCEKLCDYDFSGFIPREDMEINK